ncbi:MAG TPA: DNA-binding protein [Alphaproteobacteria bacterium]|nr:DNA-binding protein [Alphaproteobacteria bacterium]
MALKKTKRCRRLTPAQLAKRWGCSVKKLANMRVAGTGPTFIKTGPGRNAAVVYRLIDVVKWEKANSFTNTSQRQHAEGKRDAK